MSEDVLTPLMGASLRIGDKAGLDRFLGRPDAAGVIASSSFEQVFFTIKTIGLGDSVRLLPYVSASQVRGFIDLDCWRKDKFVPRPFMEWIAGFVAVGPEHTVRALGGIDEDVVALFLKDLIEVFEIERDEPPPATELTFTPDGRLAVRQKGSGEDASVAALILDALFRYAPDPGLRLLRRVRYTTRAELEETAYENKIRRLDVHGFVDYYEALSIYTEPEAGETFAKPSPGAAAGTIPGDASPQRLPTVFAESLAGARFLMAAFEGLRGSDIERVADELTALGNRILSANLVNLGEVDGVRGALGEMKGFLTIGLECLSGGEVEPASAALRGNHMQAVFRTGFAEVARLRSAAERLIRIPGFKPELLESPDVELLGGLARFKPLLWAGEGFRNFETLREVREAAGRIGDLVLLVKGILAVFVEARPTLRQTFNTAVVRKAISGKLEPIPLKASELESFVAGGVRFPDLDLPEEILPFVRDWLEALRRELEPLAGTKIDPRFVGGLHVEI